MLLSLFNMFSCHNYFLFLALKTFSAYAIPLTPTKALILSADARTGARHRYQRLSIHHIKARLITCRSRDPTLYTILTPHYAFLSIVPLQPMPIPFGSISLIHRITIRTGLFHNRRPFYWVPLALSFLSPLVSLLIPRPLFISLLSSRYYSQLPYLEPHMPSLFPFLSFSFPSHSYWLYHYIFILGIYSSTYSSFVSLARNCLTTFPS